MSWFLAETVVRQEFLKTQDSQALAWGRWQGPLLCQALWKPGSHLEPVAGTAVPRLPALCFLESCHAYYCQTRELKS